jgi:hypothetical protein
VRWTAPAEFMTAIDTVATEEKGSAVATSEARGKAWSMPLLRQSKMLRTLLANSAKVNGFPIKFTPGSSLP